MSMTWVAQLRDGGDVLKKQEAPETHILKK